MTRRVKWWRSSGAMHRCGSQLRRSSVRSERRAFECSRRAAVMARVRSIAIRPCRRWPRCTACSALTKPRCSRLAAASLLPRSAIQTGRRVLLPILLLTTMSRRDSGRATVRAILAEGPQGRAARGNRGFLVGCACARLGRVPLAQPGTDAELSASYGYNLDARDYSKALKQLVTKRGVETLSGRIADVKLDGERIISIELEGSSRVEADLFVDASGAERVLMMRLPGAQFHSWSERFACDRILAASAARLQELAGIHAENSAFRGGWISLHPLRDRTAITAVYSSNGMPDQAMIAQLGVLARLPISGEAVVSEIKPGVLERAWIGNCVAVGEAAVAIEPLDAIPLHVVQGCISHLMALFPATAEQMPEAKPYNQTIRAFASKIADFTRALPAQPPLRRAVLGSMPRRSSRRRFERKIDLFSARGAVPLSRQRDFRGAELGVAFLGAGIDAGWLRSADRPVPDEPLIGKVQQRLRTSRRSVRRACRPSISSSGRGGQYAKQRA